MAVLKLPRLQTGTAIVDHANGKPITALTRFWDAAMSQIEDNLNAVIAAQEAADAAQGSADTAQAAADAAQADADAAQATADAAKATADALDAALDVAAGKILHVLNTMTLAGIDGSTLNIGTGGTLGSAAFTNASDYLPSGTSLAFLPIAGGTLTGPLIVSSTISVSGHTTFEGVTSTGATGTGKLVYDLSPTLTTPNIGAAIGASLFIGNATAIGSEIFLVRQTTGGTTAAHFVNAAASPADAAIAHYRFSASSPNNGTAWFWYCDDATAIRAFLNSNGGISNYSANNVNLSDADVKGAVERYSETQLDALERSFLKVNWGRFKYLDQTHDDWNHGYTAQGIEEAFAGVAPELVDETMIGTKAGSGITRKAVYDADLTHIGMALLARALKRIDAVEAKMYAAGIV
jgi:hypothetical protein